MRYAMGVATVVFVLSATASARAQYTYGAPAPAAQPAPQVVAAERWFGWQTLIVMGGGTVLTPVFGVGLGGLWLGPPIVHWAHGQVGEGFAVLGINTALGVTGAIAAYAGYCGSDFSCSSSVPLEGLFAIGGAALGMLIGGTIDVIAWTYEPDVAMQGTLDVLPHLELTAERATLGVAGVF